MPSYGSAIQLQTYRYQAFPSRSILGTSLSRPIAGDRSTGLVDRGPATARTRQPSFSANSTMIPSGPRT